ncbi:phage tail tape measure protein [Pseudomonas baetica]|uniref:phage tail tape measure protein n=1 Tax=Pseudomonas baetica TaxID=674054 RepID=UPI003EE83756
MADSKYSPVGASINSLALSQSGSASEASGPVGFKDTLSGLSLALTTASLDIRLLVAEQLKLRETLALLNGALSAQQSPLKANASVPAAGSEPKSRLKAEIDQRTPPELLKSAMATEWAMVELNQVLKLDKAPLQKLSESLQKMAADKQVAPSGATVAQLAQVELAAVKGGIGKGLDSAGQQNELLDFTRDSAVMASAFNLDVKSAGEMLLCWRTSMQLDREQSLSLADAVNHLGNSGLNIKAADVGAVVQRSGEAGTAAGLSAEQVAALAAAFLNSNVGAAGADAGLKSLATGLAKGDAATAEQRKAWAELNDGLDPGSGIELNARSVADGLRTDSPGTIKRVLDALKIKSAEEQRSLTKTLFDDSAAILELLKKPEDVQRSLLLVSERNADATLPAFKGSVAQTAQALGETSQGRWNALDASKNRMFIAGGNALAPLTDGLMVSLAALADGLSEVAQAQPKATAGLLVLAGALALARGAQIKVAMASAITAAATKLLVLAGARPIPDAGDLTAEPKEQRRKGNRKKGSKKTAAPSKAPNKPTIKSADRLPPMTMGSRLLGAARMGSAVTGRVAPLMLASAGYDALSALKSGDTQALGGALGSAGGGLAGTYAGAAAGALIGSFVPVLGTAVGGVIGGLLGGMAGSWGGEWLGEKIAAPADRLAAADQVSQRISSPQTNHQQNALTANIYINGQDQASASQLANLVVQQITGQFGVLTMPNTLAIRSDAALTDGGT